MTDKTQAALKLALEALEVVTKELLAVRDELAERGGRPKTNVFHQRLWDSAFKAYTDHALPAAVAIREALAEQPAQQEEPDWLDKEQTKTDWDHVWLLIKAASHASSRGFISGTSNWGSAVSRYMRNESPQPAQQQEPFGYFKAEPFGWTDCAETDEGAIALYERPPTSKPLTDEQKLMCWARATHDADVEHKTEHQCLMDYGCEIEAAHGVKGDA